jgi:hypothetical protein
MSNKKEHKIWDIFLSHPEETLTDQDLLRENLQIIFIACFISSLF